jgi:hypothetical protein
MRAIRSGAQARRRLPAALLVLAWVLVFPHLAAAYGTYVYEVTTSETGTANSFHPSQNGAQYLSYAGTISTTSSITFDVGIQIDDASKSVYVYPTSQDTTRTTTMWATAISGSASLDLTISCAGSPCQGTPTHCTYSGLQLTRDNMNAIWETNAGPDSFPGYTDQQGAYTAHKVRFQIMTGWIGPPQSPGSCQEGTGGTRIDPSTFNPANDDLVGISWVACVNLFDIPLDQLGQQTITAPSEGDPTSCQTSPYNAEFDAQVQRTTTMRLLSAPVSIASASLDFDARVQRRAAKLRAQVATLGDRKSALEGQLVSQQARASRAIEGLSKLDPQIAKVQTAIGEVLGALNRLKADEQHADPALRGLLEAEDRYSKRVDALEQQILDAERRGGGAGKLKHELKLAHEQLASVESVLRDRVRGSPIGELKAQWLARLRTLQDRAFALQDQAAALLAQQGDADAQLTTLTGALRDVDNQLFDLGELLSRFEPEVTEVDAQTGGATIFKAKAQYSYADLYAINQKIAAKRAQITEIEAGKKNAFATFRDAEKDAIASQKHLASLLYKLAYARFATDLLFDTYDIVKATAKGGVVGAVAEFGKKLIEKGLKELAGEPGNGIEPGSLEAQINAEFKAGLKDAYSQPQIVRVVGERLLKDTALKAGKDYANATLGQYVFDKVEYPFRFKLESGSPLPGGGLDYDRLKTSLGRLEDQLKSLRKGFLGNFADKPSLKKFFAGEAENIAKDALKTMIKGGLDRAEQVAWIDFFVNDAIARSLYTPYHAWADLWESAMTDLDNLLAQKAALLKGSPPGQLVTQLSTPFDQNAKLQISVSAGGYDDPSDPIQVFVNGVQATDQGSGLYSLDVSQLSLAGGRTLSITLR